MSEDAVEGAAKTRAEAARRGGKLPSPWTPAVLELLKDWRARAATTSSQHYRLASSLARLNIRFGIPVVVLTTFVGTSVFATLQTDVHVGLRIGLGLISVLAAVLASLQTFLRFGERAEKHRASAELWAALRREIDEMLALHPTYLASRGDPKQYLDDLRRRMDEIAQQSPELGEHGVWRARRRYDEPSREAASREHLAPPPEPRGVEEQAQRPQPEG
ncbi:MAG: SLATT domain-containing protein [Actinobacteria bacterium]|nr:MAG: SLATT domain-containing protein [Actinomycetota bacterium]